MTQKDDDGQGWHLHLNDGFDGFGHHLLCYRASDGVHHIKVASFLRQNEAEQALADHRDAQQLREQLEQERHYKRNANQQAASLAVEKVALEERVRVLEEALGKHVVAMHILQHANDVEWETCEKGMCPKARALLSPAAATEGAP